MSQIGAAIPRKDGWEKVTGTAKYNSDFLPAGTLHARLLTSTQTHARIISIDATGAWAIPGVRAVVTGDTFPVPTGPLIEDRPPLAWQKVRYYGEPIAVVVAANEAQAKAAVDRITVAYELLPPVLSVTSAMQPGAPLVHEKLADYTLTALDIHPEPNSNIADRIKIRKGDMQKGWDLAEVVVEASYSLPQADHIAMETRNVGLEILPGGQVNVFSSTQAPFEVRKAISQYFGVAPGDVVVHTPLVGGGYGGKAPVQLELIAYLASKAVGGRMVRLANTREEDIVSSPCKLGLEARVKLGATSNGELTAASFTFLVDTGGYANTGPRMAKSMAVSCTGPYQVPNVWCDALCVYTNHPYATSFRGFGHLSCTFCMERAMDKLAYALQMDPAELRRKNAILPGMNAPTQMKLTESNLGDVSACLAKARELIRWDEGIRIEIGRGKVRAKGIACFWKTSDSPTDAHSGATITFLSDGTINLNVGAVEIGPGTKTALAQILADRLRITTDQVFVELPVNTRTSPYHWKTVASMTTYMVGSAVVEAADDAIRQIKSLGAAALRCSPEQLEVAHNQVFLKADPGRFIDVDKLVYGYKYTDGNAMGGQVIGRGSFIMRHLTPLNHETGEGKPGPYWTPGVQAVEVEYDTADHTYRLVTAVTVIDAGRVINPKIARGVITGGMNMGFGIGSREEFLYGPDGTVLTTSLRTYKPMRFGENPAYRVHFIETPQADSPGGMRGMGEHGIIGIPAALANALSAAAQAEINQIPVTPELIWRLKEGPVR
ncbi:MAG: xanthine dehydrogenase family protein molybdopterin-binding subunit [Solirubrobacterales bacterium]